MEKKLVEVEAAKEMTEKELREVKQSSRAAIQQHNMQPQAALQQNVQPQGAMQPQLQQQTFNQGHLQQRQPPQQQY